MSEPSRQGVLRADAKRQEHSTDPYPLQDAFLAALCHERVLVTVYLLNGVTLQGQIESFDQFSVLLKNYELRMIYKRLISTVIPACNVRIRLNPASGGGLNHPKEPKMQISLQEAERRGMPAPRSIPYSRG